MLTGLGNEPGEAAAGAIGWPGGRMGTVGAGLVRGMVGAGPAGLATGEGAAGPGGLPRGMVGAGTGAFGAPACALAAGLLRRMVGGGAIGADEPGAAVGLGGAIGTGGLGADCEFSFSLIWLFGDLMLCTMARRSEPVKPPASDDAFFLV